MAAAIPSALDAWRDVIHPAALILPRPNAGEYADLKSSIEAHGLLSPLSTFVDLKGEHWLLDGVSRLQVCVELDKPVLDAEGRWAVPTIPYHEADGADPYEIALSLNITRRHLTPEQKRDVIRELREQRPDLSDRGIAKLASASPHTVAAVRHEQEVEEAQSAQQVIDAAVAAANALVDTPQDGYAEGTIEEETDTDTIPYAGLTEAPVAPEPPAEPPVVRLEETGKEARGRKPGKAREKIVLPTTPFVGTVLPSATKAARVGEVRRCIKYLRLIPEDVRPRA